MESLVVLGTACLLGFLHALEVDHMLAVTAFVTRRPALATAANFGFRWGVGHSAAVLLAGGVLLVTGLRLPDRLDALGEGVVGLMLVGLGLWAFRSAARLHLHDPAGHGGHAHLHAHPGDPAHEHAHHHHDGSAHHHPHDDAGHHHPDAPGHGHDHAAAGHPHPHPHEHAPAHAHDARHDPHHPHRHGPGGHAHDHQGITLVGLMHGLAGTSAVVALLPVTLLRSKGLGLGYLLAFGCGTIVGMTLFASVAALAMRQAAERSLAWGRLAARLVGAAGVVVGVWWVLRAAGVVAA